VGEGDSTGYVGYFALLTLRYKEYRVKPHSKDEAIKVK
jgi:hypothetical protein